MAASGRAREAPSGIPQLKPTVDQVLHKCGEHADLVLECLLDLQLREQSSRSVLFTSAQKSEQMLTGEFGVKDRPLLRVVQEGRAECSECSPLGRLQIQSCSQSGSSMEGVIGIIKLDAQAAGPVQLGPQAAGWGGVPGSTSSDIDMMLQLGPVEWVRSGSTPATGRLASRAGGHLGGRLVPSSPPRLSLAPTDNPGFVLIMSERQDSCAHSDTKVFSGESVRRLVYDYCKFVTGSDDALGSAGPSTWFDPEEKWNTIKRDGNDMVPCLHANWWPSEEFFKRRRTCDWPPAAVRDDIKRFGIHLVPVGAKGSQTECEEWRLSFSRAEVVTAWHLAPAQLSSLVVSKTCKAALGPEGKAVKSYYLKTTLLWLCQETPVDAWKSIMQGLMMMMDFLEKAINDRYLPCFFWTGINLLRKSTPEELDAMRRTVGLIRRHATRLLAHELSPAIEAHQLPLILLNHPAEKFTERQLRICLARLLVNWGIMHSFTMALCTNDLQFNDLTFRIMLRSAAMEEMARLAHDYGYNGVLQAFLYRALTVAPDDIKAQCRLTSLGNDMFSWDAAPLVALLTPAEVQASLGSPQAAEACLQRLRGLPAEQRPSGLPPDLSTPRAQADLLLNPPLLARYIRELQPAVAAQYDMVAEQQRRFMRQHPVPSLGPFDQVKARALGSIEDQQRLADGFRRFLRLDQQAALVRARHYRDETRRFYGDPSTEAEYNRIRTRLPDSWRLRQFVFTSSN